LALFRRTTPDGHAAWLDPSYPEILGLIGFSYFAVALLYIPTRRWRWAPSVWLVLLVTFNIFSTAKLITFPRRLPIYFWPFGNGAMASLIMAGIVTSLIFLGIEKRPPAGRAMTIASVFGILAITAGWICIPLGISKIRATPTWSLWNIGAATLIFTFLYWICDRKQWTTWAFLLRPAGSNTLLTYLLPDLWYFLLASLGITYLDTHMNLGWAGVIKTLIFTVLMLALASTLTKARVRLQL
jgi:heparan-alpha-glucosaminide N-acetyltransferase